MRSIMRYQPFGHTGLCVSDLVVGTLTWGGETPERECHRILDVAAAAGINTLDTAPVYPVPACDGESERILGRLISARHDRDQWLISTKVGMPTRPDDPNSGRAHNGAIRRQVEEILRRLRTDYLDILWRHADDVITPIEEVWSTFDTLVREGKVRCVGLSNTTAHDAARAATIAELRGWCPLAGIQAPYNVARRDIERDQLPMAAMYGCTVFAWSPLAHGLLTGRFGTDRRAANGDTRITTELYGHLLTGRNLAAADSVNTVALARGVHPVQVALAWVRTQRRRFRARIVPIVGARNHEQLQVSLDALGLDLTPDELDLLADASPIEPGFPGNYEAAEMVYGNTRDLIDIAIDR
jgi:aryl-alcohol dehydrogenase-like predicted oxidoreductase